MTTIESLLKMMLSSLDDDNRSTRSYVCKLFLIILSSYGKALDKDQLHKLYPEFIKRLDDQSEDIRFEIIRVFHVYIDSLNQNYDNVLYQAHLQTIFENVLLYLDDPNLEIQLKIFSNYFFINIKF
jgi:dynein assembly factor 5